MQVPGTAVQTSDASDGISMTFTTTTGDVGELRNRVRVMAEHMNAKSHGAATMMGDAGTNMMMSQGMGGAHGVMGPDSGHAGTMTSEEMMGGGHGMIAGSNAGSGMMMGEGMGMTGGAEGGGSHMMMPVRASVEDVPGGARLRVTPVDASRLEEMKQHVQQRTQMMNAQRRCI
jgi:hypothetical protein